MASSEVCRRFARPSLSYAELGLFWFARGSHVPLLELQLLRSIGSNAGRKRKLRSIMKAMSAASRSHGNTIQQTMFVNYVEGDGGRRSVATMEPQDSAPTPSHEVPILVEGGEWEKGDNLGSPVARNSSHPLQLESIFSKLSIKTEDDLLSESKRENVKVKGSKQTTAGTNITVQADSDVPHLLRVLNDLGIYAQPTPYRNLEDRLDSPETFCKNLFLKDRKGQFFLVVCREETDVDLKALRRQLKAYRNFSFATANDMATILNVTPGGVTPFAMMFQSASSVKVVMTTDVLTDESALLNFHPLDPSLTLAVTFGEIQKFLEHFHVELQLIDLP